jgi:cytoskeletal protein RodZ
VRLSTGLTWIVLAGVAVAIYRDPQLKTLPATWLTEAQQMITSHQATQSSDQTADTTSSTTSSSASSSTSTSSTTASSDATPIESNVQGKTLATTYYYHFKDNVPTAVRQEFERAVGDL